MCNPKQMAERPLPSHNGVSWHETIPGDRDNEEKPPMDPKGMVKLFRRNAAGREAETPADLRTAGALERSVAYLMKTMDATTRFENGEAILYKSAHDFVWIRLRSVLSDVSTQQFSAPEDLAPAIRAIEMSVAWHLSEYHRSFRFPAIKNRKFVAEQEQANMTALA
ncbi:unnamed protein product, partial [Phaeothamnion confervicola]